MKVMCSDGISSQFEEFLKVFPRLLVQEYIKQIEAGRPQGTVLNKILPSRGAEGEQRCLNVDGVSRYLCVPKGTIYTWVSTKKIPARAIIRLGRSLKFDIKEIDAWVNAQNGRGK